MPEQDAPLHRFGLLLVPGFSSLAVNLVTEPLFIANWLAGRSLFTWQTLSVDGFAVRSSNGSQTSVDAPLTGDPQADFDTVFVVASFDVRASAEKTRMIEWLRSTARTRVRVGAIEIGSEILMEAGLLHGSSIPVHWYNAKGSEERFHDIKVTETLFETAGRHPLSAGGLATLDMMLDHIAQDAGDSLAEEVGRHLLVDMRRPGTRPQPCPGMRCPRRRVAVTATPWRAPMRSWRNNSTSRCPAPTLPRKLACRRGTFSACSRRGSAGGSRRPIANYAWPKRINWFSRQTCR